MIMTILATAIVLFAPLVPFASSPDEPEPSGQHVATTNVVIGGVAEDGTRTDQLFEDLGN